MEQERKKTTPLAVPILLSKMISGRQHNSKRSPLFRLGINLGPFPLYACNVSLVFNISTCLVSPQYHIRHDEFFKTTCYSKTNIAIPSMLQQWAGLVISNRDNSLEMHDVVHQGNESYVPETAANMACNIQNQPQIPSFGNNETPISKEIN